MRLAPLSSATGAGLLLLLVPIFVVLHNGAAFVATPRLAARSGRAAVLRGHSKRSRSSSGSSSSSSSSSSSASIRGLFRGSYRHASLEGDRGSSSRSSSTTTARATNEPEGIEGEGKRSARQILSESRDLLSETVGMIRGVGVGSGTSRTVTAARAAMISSLSLTRGIIGSVARGQSLRETVDKAPPKLLRELFEGLGATYVKIGQFIASSPSLFPPEYVREFQKLLDSTEPVSWRRMRRIIEKDLGRPLTEVYAYVNTKPLASASIAQVYEARLKDGSDVVIKVQKPGVGSVLNTDLSFLYVVSRVVELVNPRFATRLSTSDIVGDIRTSMLDELDFELEAKNLSTFSDFLERERLLKVSTCPKVYWDATTKKVLTMERLRGVSLTDLDAIGEYTDDPAQTLIDALNTWTLSVMKNDFFHADVHAGNLLVLDDGRVGFIDFGIVGRFSPGTWKGVSGLADALVEENFEAMAESLCVMGATVGTVDIDRFAMDLKGLWSKFNNLDPAVVDAMQGGDVGSATDDEVTGLLMELVQVSNDNGLKLPREFGLLIKQQLYFDRYTRLLAPTLDPLRDSRIAMQERVSAAAGGDDWGAEADPTTPPEVFAQVGAGA